ncbi:MAG TPA: PLP-dependent aminotransferase family protein [Candidatus Baltobacteraceae bacterium]|jgi:GntR family transcriptional regulator/MocR family aminotransferase|nr:PLP-dependent aminotransferase family protein [Candidatus Baltobacteraceae bacterium]
MKEPIDLEPLFPDRASGEALGAQLVRRLRRAIETGFFPPAVRLLPTRELAKRLGVARNTVAFAFDQLVAEGYLEARIGAGTFVSTSIGCVKARSASSQRALPRRAAALAAAKAELDRVGSSFGPLRAGVPDLTLFPFHAWQRLARKHLHATRAYLHYGESPGLRALREAISRHIAQFRGVVADPDQVVVVEGAQGAMHLIALALTQPGDAIAIEDPCYQHARAVFRTHRLALRAVPVDEMGMRTDELPQEAALAYVSPSHQFPLGVALPQARRIELLQWARRANAYVIEDDYDSEFDAHPLPSLQSLDRDGRVIYAGTFSKTLAPGLRLGYVVAPPHLADAFRTARDVVSLGASAQLQATLADFLGQGYFSRHVRRMVGVYERRRRIVVDALARNLPAEFRVGPAQTGLHVAVRGSRNFDDVAAADSMGPGRRCLPFSPMCVRRKDCKGLLVGFSSADEDAVAEAATALARQLRGVR